MNVVISDTAEYGNYLFANAAIPLLAEKLMPSIGTDLIGKAYTTASNSVDNKKLVDINKTIREHGVETIGAKLRGYMTDMKAIVETV
jgi:ketol-acid reductoisomerase